MENILYKSTRDSQKIVTASQAILKGLSDDGGLFVPAMFPVMNSGKIAHEWSGEEFASFDPVQIENLKLRPLEVSDILSPGCGVDCDCSGSCKADLTAPDPAGGITLKKFYFSYHRNPYLFWKKSFSEDDSNLSLCIPRLVLPKGAVIGVIGKNGTGKSTFLKCVCGLEKDCRGIIECDGIEYRGRKRLAFSYMVMQDVNHQLFTDSVESEVLLSMKEDDKERCDKIEDHPRYRAAPFFALPRCNHDNACRNHE